MKTKHTAMELVRYEKNDDTKVKKYQLHHHNETTHLEQTLTVTKKALRRGWEIDIEMNEFPRIDDELESLLKYGDWLERLGIAIRREAKKAIKQGVK
ncbi:MULTISPECIES: hypothetical protein [Xenorhabdus]|uniref:hypothetical protein n=1 Tax=Xenorhabdus TaxID=626 RepID=UPI00064B2A7E|nr:MULTISPECIES: hypothetical protein [Xenorhabdus]KLU17455.1 hypothetical protein AAY47_00050 [Xenorhabdus griffiniae]KOP34691.1 hypothetical protein AFK69_03165 [Xenorhabdus sp. GDc328]